MKKKKKLSKKNIERIKQVNTKKLEKKKIVGNTQKKTFE